LNWKMWENKGLGTWRKGMTGIEVLVALGILGLVAVVFLGGLSTALKASYLADERSVAESLARSEMEYVKSQEYSTDAWSYTVTTSGSSSTAQPSWFDPGHALSAEYAGYSVEVGAEDFDADEDGELDADDEGIRRITDAVKHNSEEIFVLASYKVDR
jgi:type II secretory pathway pseudopilin PulG